MKLRIQLAAALFVASALIAGCGGGSSSGSSSNNTTNNNNNTNHPAPTAPTGLALTQLTGSSVQLTWTLEPTGSGIAYYTIYRNNVGIGHASSTTVPSYIDTGLTVGNTYVYAITAVDIYGTESAKSESLTLIPTAAGTAVNGYTLQPGESAPTNLSVSMISGKSFYWASATDKTYGQITFPADSGGSPLPGVWSQFAPSTYSNVTRWSATVSDATTMPIILTVTTATGTFQSLDTFNISALGPSYYVVSDSRANTYTKNIYRLYYGSNALGSAKTYSGN